MSENSLVRILRDKGPLSGKDLRDFSGLDELSLWRFCRTSPAIHCSIAGKRYLRLDKEVSGYARLSPSIKREFLTYTICGPAEKKKEINLKKRQLLRETARISRGKRSLAADVIQSIIAASADRELLEESVCFIIAGDVVYQMAHLEPRPERSTGKMVRGSDLDIIVISENGFPSAVKKKLDKEIYREKYMCLIRPECREEIDYIIKDLSRVEKQLKFDCFESMVAAKILWEGDFLAGSRKVFDAVQGMLHNNHIHEKLTEMERLAVENRKSAENYLLKGSGELSEEECFKLFYTRDEAEEIF